MTGARWQQVKALFQATIERPPLERAAFLTAAVGGDEALRLEVESLLESDTPEMGFTDRLPFRDSLPVADSLAESSPSGDPTRTGTHLLANANVGPYRVIALLGAGGMGEVSRARDSKLNRDVAIKVLPSAFEFDPDRLARFRREAQVLAALNHPHIAAIYGLEESNGRQALVLELVEGVTLADRIEHGPLPLVEALTFARQIAEALQAAHEKGIIHRDLKPANIKVTPAGVVKVLDFGLAKTAAGDLPLTNALQSPTVAGETRVGAVLGTAAYMSPEQARGQEVDARTDIWAFGCVLFEMLAGRKAFAADATSDSIAKILEGEPDWAALPKATPAKVRELIRQCLRKDPVRRLRTVTQARAVIEQLLARRLLSRPAWVTIGMATMIAVSVGAYVWSRLDRRARASPAEWVQLTRFPDAATQPALSPDGRMLTFLRGADTFRPKGELYIKLLPNGEPVPLTHDNLQKMGPMFSPDGSRIAYTVAEKGNWDTWVAPTLRGEPYSWLRNASGLTWHGPNEILYSEIKKDQGVHMGIVTSAENRLDARELYLPSDPGGMAHRSYRSPDGRWIVIVEMDGPGVWLPCRLVPFDGSSPGRRVGPPGARCTNAGWSPDGSWMYFSARLADASHIWRQRFPDGSVEQVTSGPTEEEGVAITPDGRSLITSVGSRQRAVWLHDQTGEHQVSVEGYAYAPLLSADGQKVCYLITNSDARVGSPAELWVTELKSGRTHRILPEQTITSFDLSRDDRIAAAVVESDGFSRVWLTSLDGRMTPRRIPMAEGDDPRFGPPNEIIFLASAERPRRVFRIHEDGSGRQVVSEGGRSLGTLSPDGQWLSGVRGGSTSPPTWAFSLTGAAPAQIFAAGLDTRLRWAPDGSRVYLSLQVGGAAFANGRTYVLPLPKGSMLPRMPIEGFQSEEELAGLPGVEVIPFADVGPGRSPETYVFSRENVSRNLYRIPLP